MKCWQKAISIWICVQLVFTCQVQALSGGLVHLQDAVKAYEREEWQRCIDNQQKAFQVGLDDVDYHLDGLVLMGRAYAQLGYPDSVRSYFSQVLDLAPDYRLNASDTAGEDIFDELVQALPPPPPSTVPNWTKIALGVGGGVMAAVVGVVVIGAGGGDGGSGPDASIELPPDRPPE